MKESSLIFLILCLFMSQNVMAAVEAGSPTATSAPAVTEPLLTPADPVGPTVPSSTAADINTFKYQSTHDVETTHSNVAPDQAAVVAPKSDQEITQDVLNRFSKVYREKKLAYGQTQIALSAAKDDLVECDKLSGTAKNNCVQQANQFIEDLTQKSSNLTYDMNTIQQEMDGLTQGAQAPDAQKNKTINSVSPNTE